MFGQATLTHTIRPGDGQRLAAVLTVMAQMKNLATLFKGEGRNETALTAPESSSATIENKREELSQTYDRIVRQEEAALADLKAQRKRALRDADSRGERERLLYAIPDAPEAYLLIRYETMLMRDCDRVVRELDRLKAWGE